MAEILTRDDGTDKGPRSGRPSLLTDAQQHEALSLIQRVLDEDTRNECDVCGGIDPDIHNALAEFLTGFRPVPQWERT